LDRRGFILQSARWGSALALTPLAACGPGGEDAGPADGTFGRPYTREDPGQWTDKIEIHQPVLYGAKIDATRVRLWCEVQDVVTDAANPKTHEMTAQHWISQIVLQDQYAAEEGQQADHTIASRSFAYDSEARLVANIELVDRVDAIEALAECNLHGWWRAVYSVDELNVDPQGDARRAYTRDQPGAYPDQVPTHVPVFGKRPNGNNSVEIGERENGNLHPMDDGHYIQHILVYDEYDQLRAQGQLNAQYEEPVIDFPPIGGTSRVRVLAYCNNYDWWEAEYSVI
jgi:desulfoferrodoxin (superoxide reductase-like protein)